MMRNCPACGSHVPPAIESDVIDALRNVRHDSEMRTIVEPHDPADLCTGCLVAAMAQTTRRYDEWDRMDQADERRRTREAAR
jgi:hypothetical protein